MQSRKIFIKNTTILGVGTAMAYGRHPIMITYQSDFLKIGLDKRKLCFNYFSTDSLGKGQLHQGPLFLTEEDALYYSKSTDNSMSYYLNRKKKAPVWEFEFSGKQIKLANRFDNGKKAAPFLISFSQKLNHYTVPGPFLQEDHLKLPCVLHLPGMGSYRIHCADPAGYWEYDAKRTNKPFINITFSAADEKIRTLPIPGIPWPSIRMMRLRPIMNGTTDLKRIL